MFLTFGFFSFNSAFFLATFVLFRINEKKDSLFSSFSRPRRSGNRSLSKNAC